MPYSPLQRFWWSVYWLFLIISFCVIGFLLVTRATGYRYNPHQQRYQKTGMVIVANAPRDSQLLLSGTIYPLRGTTRVPNVLPGSYRVEIKKEGYNSWEKNITVEPGFVASLDDVTLFRSVPVELFNVTEYEELLPYYQVQDDRLRLVNGELWFGTQLVSRFNDPPSKAILLPDNRYVLYLKGPEVRVVEVTGEHDQLLYTRQTTEAEPLAFIDGAVIFQDGPVLRVIQIQ